ncbi:hypothetical protein BD560DRAFT_395452 [Blakeslea trispora]|nr:hypothetical protein BD560DRAFT_395452 [Blakeslea trispora]
MSYTSKFTERFDIDTSDVFFRELSGSPPSPRSKSMIYSSAYLNTSNDSNLSDQIPTRPLSVPNLANSVQPIAIPKKSKSVMIDEIDLSPSSAKPHDAIANKFKQLISSLSKKKHPTSSVKSTISTKF